jgi:hypothetical protein
MGDKQYQAFPSTCCHSFCFSCLTIWAHKLYIDRIAYTCPLCKKLFGRILYEVKSNLKYKECILKPVVIETMDLILEAVLPAPSALNNYRPKLETIESRNLEKQSKTSRIFNEPFPVEFRALVYKNGWYVNPFQTQMATKELIDELAILFDETINIGEGKNPEKEEYKVILKITKYNHVKTSKHNINMCALNDFLSRELRALQSLEDSDEFSIEK